MTKKLAHVVLLYTLIVILFGAWVRMTGSGAGCGEHWPLCDGQVIPQDPGTHQMIEYTHRVTSGIYGLMVLWLVIAGFRMSSHAFPRRHLLAALFFTIVEALIGAFLVKRGLVADNDSTERAIVIALHLANTLLLLASLVKVDFFFSYTRQWQLQKNKWRDFGITTGWILVAALGAITALGDTLFPAESLLQGIQADFDPSSPFLIQIRIFHPALAILVSLLTLWRIHGEERSGLLKAMILIAVAFGFVNVALLVPHWAALAHLLMANIIWILWIRWTLWQRQRLFF